MADLGERLTEERLESIKDKLNRVYSEAASDLQKKAEEFTKKHEERDKYMRSKLSDADYKKWQQGQVFIGKQWQSKIDQMARSMVDVERTAVQIVNGEQISCFADNANYTEFSIDKDNGFGLNFSIYDADTVEKLIAEDPELLRRRYVDGKACEAWNVKTISNCVTQGILQGETIGQIAKRIARDTASTDMKAMVRYARTAMTCAQNAGRLQGMRNTLKQGVYVKKIWLATGDERTRPAHDELDGQEAEINEPFDSELGPIMYPGDPDASDENVWNCRCALGYDYPDKPEGSAEEEEEYDEEAEEEEFEEWVEAGGKQEEETLEIPDSVRDQVDEESAYDDWFDYEYAKLMREYMETGDMPDKDSQHNEVSDETRQRIAADAELIQKVGSETKTEDSTLYRGMVLEEKTLNDMFVKGQKYEFDTLTATTPDKKLASVYSDTENAGFGVPVIIEIQKPGGIYGFKGNDAETILPKGSEFRVERKFKDENGVYHVSLYAPKKGRNVN